MASVWNHTIRRYIQTTAVRRSGHETSEGKVFLEVNIQFFFTFVECVNQFRLCNTSKRNTVCNIFSVDLFDPDNLFFECSSIQDLFYFFKKSNSRKIPKN